MTTRLSEVLGARVSDIEVLGHERFPPALALLIRSGRHVDRVGWAGVGSFTRDGVVVTGAGHDDAVPAARLLLGRDVLDTQVVDLAGHRLARVAEVELAVSGREARAVAVD